VIENTAAERRRHGRYQSDLKLAFYVSFDLEASINFRVKKQEGQKFSKAKYSGTTKNISAEGLCFISNVELCKRDHLSLDLYLPNKVEPVVMEARVRWSRIKERKASGEKSVETGIKIITVGKEDVEKSVVFDEIHKIYWSNILEIVFGDQKHQLLST
jgi:hypothetical protein